MAPSGRPHPARRAYVRLAFRLRARHDVSPRGEGARPRFHPDAAGGRRRGRHRRRRGAPSARRRRGARARSVQNVVPGARRDAGAHSSRRRGRHRGDRGERSASRPRPRPRSVVSGHTLGTRVRKSRARRPRQRGDHHHRLPSALLGAARRALPQLRVVGGVRPREKARRVSSRAVRASRSARARQHRARRISARAAEPSSSATRTPVASSRASNGAWRT